MPNLARQFLKWPWQKPALRLDLRYPLRHLLAVRFRRVSISRVPLLVLLGQSRKLLSHKGQKLLGGRRHEEQYAREKPLGTRFPRRLCDLFQISIAIGDTWDQGRSRHSDTQSCFVQL